MPWQIRFNKEHPIIEVGFHGMLSSEELLDVAQKIVETAALFNPALVLVDATELVGGHSLFDLYSIADSYMGHELIYTFKEAVLMPKLKASAENTTFWETLCFNRGIKVQLFNNRDQAIAWLLE